ncbi:MAG: AmmeMemoRadiSam system protein B [Nitrospirota bacterium]
MTLKKPKKGEAAPRPYNALHMEGVMIRQPAVAGRFYEGSPALLKKEVGRFIVEGIKKERAIGVVSPHAGYIYSGAVAGAVYSHVIIPKTIILLGPNHTGIGKAVSVFPEGEWVMPNGAVVIDTKMVGLILKHSKTASADYHAHQYEHSLEVQIPFLQYFTTDFSIVPITIMDTSLRTCRDIGEAIAQAVLERRKGEGEKGGDVLIVSSTDMTHYETHDSAKAKDKKAIDRILALDPEGLHKTIKENNISMCGFAPTTALLYAARMLGAKEARLIKYMTSGEVSGDYDQVVGYAGVVIR